MTKQRANPIRRRSVLGLLAGGALAGVATPAGGQRAREGDGAAGETITLGCAISMTGARAVLAGEVRRGYDFAVRGINEAGGVRVGNRSYRLNIVYEDDESGSSEAGRATERMMAAGVRLFLGPYGSNSTERVGDIVEAGDGLLLFCGAASVGLFERNWRRVFSVITMADEYLSSVVAMAADQTLRQGGSPRGKRLAIAFMDDAFGRDLRQGVLNEAARWQMEVVVDETLPGPVVADLQDVLVKVQEARPDILIISGYNEAARLTAEQLSSMRVDVPMVAVTHCDTARVEQLGARAEYLLCTTQWDGYLPYRDRWFGSSVEYQVSYDLHYGETPTYLAAQGSATVVTLADALERAGSLDTLSIRNALATSTLETLLGPVRFNANGRNIAKPMYLWQIQGGRYKVVWPTDSAWAPLVHPRPRWTDM